MSYNVTLNKKLPEQGVYDQLLGGHIEDRKLMKLYPRASSGPYMPHGHDRIEFRIPDQGHVDTLRSYMTFDVVIRADFGDTQRYNNITLGGFTTNIRNSDPDWVVGGGTKEPPNTPASVKDHLAYIPGGFNGSTASFFSRFQVKFDNECVEDIEEYHGLAAILNMNIPEAYRTSAAGHLQFLSPRGSREMILNALVRGDSALMYQADDAFRTIGMDARKVRAETKTTSGTYSVSEYRGLMHLPTSGIMSNPKLLPTKYMPPVDIEFQLAPVVEALQIASGFAVNKFVSTAVGAFAAGPPSLVMWDASGRNSSNEIGGYYADDTNFSIHLWQYILAVMDVGPANTQIDSQLKFDNVVVNPRLRNSISYEIHNPVYHIEQVYMSQQYDAAFASALTRGVTYAYETYAHSSTTLSNEGVTYIPTAKTSVKSVLTGFVNATMRDSVFANYWHFVNPDIKDVSLRFGSKLLPSESMEVSRDNGLRALTMYMKAVGNHHDAKNGLNYTWSRGAPQATDKRLASMMSFIDPAVVKGAMGCTETGSATWCRCSGTWPKETDAHTAFGDYPTTYNLAHLDLNSPLLETRGGTGWTDNRLSYVYGKDSFRDLARCIYEYNVGSFVLAMDVEAEQGALSGFNTSMTTSMLQWELKLEHKPDAQMNVHTWLRHDKALRLEPQGRVSIVLD